MITLQRFKKTLLIGVLMGSSILLSACGDDNPMLKEPFKKYYEEKFTGYMRESIKLAQRKPCKNAFCYTPTKEVVDRVTTNAKCPYYFKNPDNDPSQETRCENWLKTMKGSLQRNYEHYAEWDRLPYVTLTDDNVHDPVFWDAMTNAMEKEVK